ncbi:MAG: thioredoxin domain-containing protein [Actinomycetota bacterium]
MTATLIVMAVVAAAATALAVLQQRGRAAAPTVARGEPPTSLDRRDFRGPNAPWLIAVFSSASCSSCAAVLAELREHESSDVVVVDVEIGDEPGLHSKYGIESVPTAVIADAGGDAKLAFVGPLGPDHREALHTTLGHDA